MLNDTCTCNTFIWRVFSFVFIIYAICLPLLFPRWVSDNYEIFWCYLWVKFVFFYTISVIIKFKSISGLLETTWPRDHSRGESWDFFFGNTLLSTLSSAIFIIFPINYIYIYIMVYLCTVSRYFPPLYDVWHNYYCLACIIALIVYDLLFGVSIMQNIANVLTE